ncbi:ATP-binding cassette domain-containing protein, partial [Actinomyces sp. MRS3W]|uniref:ATP-binding cassette domain-containing protein n=1 Tax=Actinomyces sp. MRS3W TaxID=2800796 RepID=UPI0028FD325C
IALIQQDPATALHPLLPVSAQVAAAVHAGGGSRAEARRRARRILARVGLASELTGRVPGRLSGGQRQRAAVALALAARPVLLLADEVTTNLDVIARAELLELLTSVTASPEASAGPTPTGIDPAPALLLVTHDLAAAAICDRIVVLDRGRVIESGPARRVLTRPQHPLTRAMREAAREETLTEALHADADSGPCGCSARPAVRTRAACPVGVGA